MLSFRARISMVALLVSPAAFAAPTSHHPTVHKTTAKLIPVATRVSSAGKSVGSPTEGHLLGGAHLQPSSYLRIVPAYANGDVRWGLEPLVGMIDRAGKAVHKQFPDAVLSVGHLSRAGGGEIDRHASHESGRDADIGFYVRNQQNKPIYADHFVAFRGDGAAPTWPGAAFDDARNWALVAAIVGDAQAHVSHIFVAMPIRARLLSYAEKIGAPPALRTRAAELMAQPRGSLPHDDHFHVRIGCPSGMSVCIEQPLAKKHHHAASSQAQAHNAHHETGHSAAHASSPRPTPGNGAAKSAPTSKAPSSNDDDSSSKAEALVPSLAPMVPGLDAAVIPAPLVGPRTETPPSPEPHGAPAIDDPDGILESQ